MKISALAVCLIGITLTSQLTAQSSVAPISGELKVSSNPNYFQDVRGHVLLLSGSHTWNTIQDWGTDGSPQALDFSSYVSFLTRHGNNFTVLWSTELPKFRGLPNTAGSPPEFTVSFLPWKRTGPGAATDGGLKFDLTKFD